MQVKKIYGRTFHENGTPKGFKYHLSYSAIECWLKNKPEYRKRYYEGAPSFTSAFTIFGNEVHKQVEMGELSIGTPKTAHHELKLEGNIKGVHVLGFIDVFNEPTHTIYDLKTSINPWTQVLVEKLDQLIVYQLLVRENYNKCDKMSHVIWLETKWTVPVSEEKSVKGFTMECTTSQPQLELTGRQEMFTRSVAKWERDRVQSMIVATADEIDKDFAQYLFNNK